MSFLLRGMLAYWPRGVSLFAISLIGSPLWVSCSKQPSEFHSKVSSSAGLLDYSLQVGASQESLYLFADSLKKLQDNSATSSVECLRKLHDTVDGRSSFLNCMSQKGLSGLSTEFLEELVGLRMIKNQKAKNPEVARTLRLLNWIFDLSVEQYSFKNPRSYWLVKNAYGKWKFTDKEQKNQNDFNYQKGDVTISIGPSALSTLIPHFAFSERRLTHSMLYRGEVGHREAHFIESEFEEGVRYKYRDTFKGHTYYELTVLRFNDPFFSVEQNQTVRNQAPEVAASLIGRKYGFGKNLDDGIACHYLTSSGFALPIWKLKDPNKKEVTFDDTEILFSERFSPMKPGPTRNFSAKFGMTTDTDFFPTAGDFLASYSFEPVAIYINAKEARKFAEIYTTAESIFELLGQGLEIKLLPKDEKDIEPLLRDRSKLSDLIGMSRKFKRHTILRTIMHDEGVSLEKIEDLTVEQIKKILDIYDQERKVLLDAAKDEVHFISFFKNDAFGEAKDLSDPDETITMYDFLVRMRDLRRSKLEEFKQFVFKVPYDNSEPFKDFRVLRDYLNSFDAKMAEDANYSAIRDLLGKADLKRFATNQVEIAQIDELINRVVVGFNDQDFEQLDLFINNLTFKGFKYLINLDAPTSFTTQPLTTAPYIDPNWRSQTLTNPSYFATKLPIFGKIMQAVNTAVNDTKKPLAKDELADIESYLRVYLRFLLSVPSLKKKIAEYDNREKELQDIIKNIPYIASALHNDTLIQFGAYKKIVDGVGTKMDEHRAKIHEEFLWQTTPWYQKSAIDMILNRVEQLRLP